MMSVADIFSALGGPSSVARELGLGTSTASEMKRRGSIPAEYWRDLIQIAQRRGVAEVTADALVEAHGRTSREQVRRDESPDGSGSGARPPTGHFSRFYHLARPHFSDAAAIREHVSALRDEWEGR